MEYKPHPAADLFPLLDGAEFEALAEDIKANGLLDPIVLTDAGEILDGRNRYRACVKAGVEPRYRTEVTHDPYAYVISKNLARRQLTPGQRAFVALKLKAVYVERAAERQRAGIKDLSADRHQGSAYGKRAATQAAKAAGTSGRLVSRAERIDKAAPDLAARVKAGILPIDRADRIIRDRESEMKHIRSCPMQPAYVDIRLGDFREVLADLRNVDAIITDPPYPKEYLPLLEDLAIWADMVLKPDGVMAILLGQSYLPEAFSLLNGARPYRWTSCYLTPGPGYVSHPRKVQSNWKPVLIYGGGPRFADVVKSEGTDAAAKDYHLWGQDYGAFHVLVERLTVAGQLVVDPFMGSGTTLVAARALNRNAIGCDMDEASVARARERLTPEEQLEDAA